MTEHYTMQEAVDLARECGFDIGSGITERVHVCTTGKVHTLINTAVTRKLAEKELEVVRLRSQLFGALMEAAASHEDTAISVKYDADVRKAADCAIEWTRAQAKALSTPSSTKHLDEYVAEKVKGLEAKIVVLKQDFDTKSEAIKWMSEQLSKLNDRREILELNYEGSEHKAAGLRRELIEERRKLAAAEDRVKELERRVQQLEMARTTYGPTPVQPMCKRCLFCGGDHGGLACPKLVATSAAIERSEG